MPRWLNKPQIFTGGPTAFEPWLAKFELWAKAQKVSDDEKLGAAAGCISDDVLH